MYKFDNGQISLEDFGQPIGMNLKNSNRWVKRAQTIPWIEIEKKYAKLFSNKKGNVAKSLRLGLGARIILSGPALGRPKKDAEIDKKQNYIDECERVEVERKFSLAKRKCGMGMIVTRLKETTCHSIAMSVHLLNLRKIEKMRAEVLLLFLSNDKLVFIQ